MHFQWTVMLFQSTIEHELCIAAVIAWLAWDLLINLDDEVAYVWSGRGKWVKMLYVFIRYSPIIHEGITLVRFLRTNHSLAVCRAWSAYNLTFAEVLTVAVELVLVIRVSALYKMNNVLMKAIFAIFATEMVFMTTLLVFAVPKQRYSPQCSSIYTPRIFIGYWLSSLLFETFLFVLTLTKFLGSGSRRLRTTGRRSFMYLIMRDGTWAFALIFLAMLASTLTYQLATSPRAGIGYSVLLGVLSFSGSHVILNIRRLAALEDDPPDTSSLISLDSIHFSTIDGLDQDMLHV